MLTRRIIITSNVPGPITHAQQPGRFTAAAACYGTYAREISLLVLLLPRGQQEWWQHYARANQCCGCARSANQRRRWWPTLLREDQHYLHYITITEMGFSNNAIIYTSLFTQKGTEQNDEKRQTDRQTNRQTSKQSTDYISQITC